MESPVVGGLILFFFRGLAWLYWFLPPGLRAFWAGSLGWLLRALRFRAKVVRQNLELAYPGSAAERARLFGQAYVHLARLALEILTVLGPLERLVRGRVELIGGEHWRQAQSQGRGVLFLASHVGNWEIMAATGGVRLGMDLMLVTKHLKPEWLHRAISGGRARCGVTATYEPRTLKDVLSHLKKNGTVGFVQDQYTGPPVGVRVPVFGVPVGTSMVVAVLAKRTGAVVLPVVNYRLPGGRWCVDIRPPAPWIAADNPNEELALNTAAYASLIERDIREHPEQWLWTHRRFKGDLGPLRPGEWLEGRARS